VSPFRSPRILLFTLLTLRVAAFCISDSIWLSDRISMGNPSSIQKNCMLTNDYSCHRNDSSSLIGSSEIGSSRVLDFTEDRRNSRAQPFAVSASERCFRLWKKLSAVCMPYRHASLWRIFSYFRIYHHLDNISNRQLLYVRSGAVPIVTAPTEIGNDSGHFRLPQFPRCVLKRHAATVIVYERSENLPGSYVGRS